jgi:hypothetical protein
MLSSFCDFAFDMAAAETLCLMIVLSADTLDFIVAIDHGENL